MTDFFRRCPDGHRCENGSLCQEDPKQEGTYYCDCDSAIGSNGKKFAGLYCEYPAEEECKFEGEIDQYPPIFSAIKKKGKRLYEYARKGEKTKIKPRKVSIYSFDFTQINPPQLDFNIRCSKGTYIRSLAHDFGKALQSGGHLSQLRRTAIGSYSVENALTPNQIIKKLEGL